MMIMRWGDGDDNDDDEVNPITFITVNRCLATFDTIKYLGVYIVVFVKGCHSTDDGVGLREILNTDNNKILFREKNTNH